MGTANRLSRLLGLSKKILLGVNSAVNKTMMVEAMVWSTITRLPELSESGNCAAIIGSSTLAIKNP